MPQDVPARRKHEPGQTAGEALLQRALHDSDLLVGEIVKSVQVYQKSKVGPEVEWQTAKLRGEAAKPLIESNSGQSLSAEEVARKLRRSSAQVHEMLQRGELIAYPTIQTSELRFPEWQFVADSLHPWVTQLVNGYGYNGWGLLNFVTCPRVVDGDAFTHLEKLRNGDVDEVLVSARRTNPD